MQEVVKKQYVPVIKEWLKGADHAGKWKKGEDP